MPMLIPLYTIAESMLIISTGNSFAKRKASSVFPHAVGPVIQMQTLLALTYDKIWLLSSTK